MTTLQLINKTAALYDMAVRMERKAKLADELAKLYAAFFDSTQANYWNKRAYYRRLGAARLKKFAASTAIQINKQLNEEANPTKKQEIQTDTHQR